MIEDSLLKTSQAITYLADNGFDISPRQLQRLTQSGVIKASSTNGRNYYSKDDLQTYIDDKSENGAVICVSFSEEAIPSNTRKMTSNLYPVFIDSSKGAAIGIQETLNHIDKVKAALEVVEIQLPLSAPAAITSALIEYCSFQSTPLRLNPSP